MKNIYKYQLINWDYYNDNLGFGFIEYDNLGFIEYDNQFIAINDNNINYIIKKSNNQRNASIKHKM